VDCLRIKDALFHETGIAIRNGYAHFISGMALGVDQWAAEALLQLKGHYPQIVIEAAIPCLNQDVKWNRAQKERYRHLLAQCDVKTVLQPEYTPGCMMERNMYMVGKSDLVIAVWNGKPGGTSRTVKYAENQNKTIVIISPLQSRTSV